MSTTHYVAPETFNDMVGRSVFLGGTIDNGSSYNWQNEVAEVLMNRFSFNVLNPRRIDWDTSWSQSINNVEFYRQVNWELNALKKADIILLNFLENSLSPITLLELGLMAESGKVRVVCPPSYWRKGNIEIVCEKYQIPLFKTINEFYDSITKS